MSHSAVRVRNNDKMKFKKKKKSLKYNHWTHLGQWRRRWQKAWRTPDCPKQPNRGSWARQEEHQPEEHRFSERKKKETDNVKYAVWLNIKLLMEWINKFWLKSHCTYIEKHEDGEKNSRDHHAGESNQQQRFPTRFLHENHGYESHQNVNSTHSNRGVQGLVRGQTGRPENGRRVEHDLWQKKSGKSREDKYEEAGKKNEKKRRE